MFGTPAPFAEAFPTVEEITVEYKENGYMLRPFQKRSGTYTKETLVPKRFC